MTTNIKATTMVSATGIPLKALYFDDELHESIIIFIIYILI